MTKHMNVPVFIPHLGCGHSCAFCSQRSVTNVQAAPSPECVAFSIREKLRTRGDKTAEIAFFGGSFTGISREMQAAYLSAAAPFLQSGEAESIRVSTRPDYIDKETVHFLKSYGVKTIELGAQSMRDKVLLASRRGHTALDTRRAAAAILEGGLTLGLQMMTGLPASSLEDEMYTAECFVEMGAENARIYPTVVFYDTLLYDWMKSGDYTPPDMEDMLSRAAAALSVLEEGDVQVIRVGLQETETLYARAAAGAYHPAMGEMVYARLWRNRLEEAVKALSGSDIFVSCPKSLVSKMLGQKRSNALYFEERYAKRLHIKEGEGVFVSDGERTIQISLNERRKS